MSEAVWMVILSGIVSMIGSTIVVSVAWWKAPGEKRQLTADTAQKYQGIADKAAEKIMGMQSQLDTLQGRVDELETALSARDRLIVEWQAGITRLIQQLESHELKPVWRPQAAAPQGKTG